MNNKKLVIGVITIFFIGVTGLIYSLGADKNKSETVLFLKDATIGEHITIDSKETKENQQEEQSETENQITDEEKTVFVHLCGEVKKPDVYEVAAGARILDAVKLAGGFTKEAAKHAINLAQVLVDGEKIYIPSIKEVKEEKYTFSKQSNEKEDTKIGILININTATKNELMALTGVGEAKASSMIAYRETNGPFKRIEDIKKIEGIKDGVFLKIKDLITVD